MMMLVAWTMWNEGDARVSRYVSSLQSVTTCNIKEGVSGWIGNLYLIWVGNFIPGE
jgi:hypothetical protein